MPAPARPRVRWSGTSAFHTQYGANAGASMRRATALLLPLLTACLLAAGCEDPVAPEFRWVYGTWEWTSSCCDIAGGAKTPETEGYGMRLVLRRENRAELFRNDSL